MTYIDDIFDDIIKFDDIMFGNSTVKQLCYLNTIMFLHVLHLFKNSISDPILSDTTTKL